MRDDLFKHGKCILVLAFLFAGKLSAQQIVTDRPDQTESSSTVGLGNLQIESGFLIGFEENAENSNRQVLAPTTLFRYGITKGIELRLVNQFETLRHQHQKAQGVSDLEIGTKIQLFKRQESATEIALLTHLILPIGTREITNGKYGTINKLSISHELGEQIGLGYNVGYDYRGNGNGDLTYSLAVGIGVNEKVGIYVEPYGGYVGFEEFILNFDAGFTYLLSDNFQLDFSFGAGASHRMNYISTGFSWLVKQG